MPHLVVPTTYAGSEVTSLLGETADGEKVTRTGPEILPRGGRLRRGADHLAAVGGHRHQRGQRDGPRGRGALRARPHRRDRRDGARRSAPWPAGCAPLQRDPDDLDARADLLYGAWLAGRCLGAVTMGLHHKLCHTLGGSFGLPHAATHTVVLPHAMAYNAPAAPDAMGTAAAALGVDDAPSGLQALVARLGGPDRPAPARLRPRRRAAGRRPGHRTALPQPAAGRARRHRRAAHPRDRGHHHPRPGTHAPAPAATQQIEENR